MEVGHLQGNERSGPLLSDLRHDPDRLHDHLLGDAHAGPGLIQRVAEEVARLGYEPGPGYRTGSITGQVDHHHEDSGDEHRVFKLYLALRYWLGKEADPTTEVARLTRHKLTDVDALIGGSEKRLGLLDQARAQVRHLLRHASEANILKLESLSDLLIEWMGARCRHLTMVPMGGDADVQVMVCFCGVRVQEVRKGVWRGV